MMKDATEFSAAKITDDLLLARKLESIHSFSDSVSRRFPVPKTIINEPTTFIACKNTKDAMGYVALDMYHSLP